MNTPKDDPNRTVSLVSEVCRLLHCSKKAVLCAMSHRQLTVDGHPIKPEDDRRWTRAQLTGRMAQLPGREAQLFR